MNGVSNEDQIMFLDYIVSSINFDQGVLHFMSFQHLNDDKYLVL